MVNKTTTIALDNIAVIGRAERIQLLDHGFEYIPAKVDTGADISSIWATNIIQEADSLRFELFAASSEYYTGQVIVLPASDYRLTRVANSFGTREMRYVVKMRVAVKMRVIKASFTLADRSTKIYPILLGRRMLAGKFLVDVRGGEPLAAEEKAKLRKLHIALDMDEG